MIEKRDKTKNQLIKELAQLRRRIAELEALGRKRNQFEEAGRSEQDKAQQYLDIAEVILVVLNKKGEITLINRKGNQILGYKEGELLGKNWFTTSLPVHLRKKMKSGFLKLMVGKRKLTDFYETPALTKSGAERIIAWHNTLLKDAGGNNIGTLSSGEDMTERRRMEEALRESEEKYRLSFINVTDVIYTLDTNLMVTSVSPSVERTLGYKVEEVMNRPFPELNILASESLEKAYADVMRIFSGEQIPATIYEFIAKDGIRKIGEISGSPLYRNGKIIGLISIARDITERKKAEAERERTLRETRVRYEVSQALVGKETEDEVLDVLIQHAGFYPQVFVVIYTFDKTEGEVAAIVRRQNPFESGLTPMLPIGSRLPVSNYTLLGRISPDQPFVSDDILTDEKIETYGRDILTETGTASIAFFPLMIDKEWMCLIMTMAKSIGCFDEEKQNLYRTLAEQGAVALRAARLREQIRESQQRFQGLVETISDWIWEADKNGVYTYVSPKVRELLGYEPEEVLGKTPFDLMPPEEAERVKSIFASLLAARQPIVALENSCRHKDGRLVVFETSSAPFFDAEGHLKGYRGVDRDITERKLAEEALREKQETINAIIETSQDWIWAVDSQGVHTYSNPAIEKILGYRTEEIIGSQSLDLIHEDDKKMVKAIFQECGEKRCGWNNLLLRWHHKDGTYRYLESNAVPILDSKGDLAGFRGVDRDITERKRAEKEIGWLANFPRLNPMPIVEVDQNGQLIYANPVAQSLLPDLEKRRGEHPFLTELNSYFVNLREKREIYSIREVEVGDRWYSQVITLSDPEHLRIYAIDITERKQAEERLKESEAQFRTLFEAIPDCVIVHDEEGVILHVNELGAQQLEWSAKDLVGRNLRAIVTHENHALITDHIRETNRNGWSKFETTYVSRSGWRIEAEVNDRPIKFGKKQAILRVSRDITARKRAEKKLRESEEKYRDLVENLNDIIYATDEQGIITYIAPTIESISDYTTSDIIGRPFFDFVYQEDMPDAVQLFRQDISGQALPHEYRMVTRAGDIRWVRVSSRPVFEGARTVGLRGILTDITERKQAEEAVKRGYEQLQETLHATVTALATTVEMKDQYTAGHQPRVTRLACAIAEEMGLPPEQIEGIRMAAAIHDIGKIMVPAEILNKPGRLTEIQYEMIKMHPQAGYDILKGLKLPWPVAQIILQHHERMDGSGYPQGLSGEKIMVEARILMVANVVEAMNAHRPYRPAYDIKEALAEISRNKGTFYDPAVVDACLRLFTERGFTLDSVPR